MEPFRIGDMCESQNGVITPCYCLAVGQAEVFRSA
jgi:hypothetical protein